MAGGVSEELSYWKLLPSEELRKYQMSTFFLMKPTIFKSNILVCHFVMLTSNMECQIKKSFI